MGNDISKVHPRLRAKVIQLKEVCNKAGIKIGTREAVRTVKEQDALYAIGRTKAGRVVTNAKGSTYSSMHQWGVAFDYVVEMDVDKDGDIDIKDLYNAKLMRQVGKLGQSIGLEWGGSWKSICDMPHFQLKDWGSTTAKLKARYKSPEAFKKTWKDYKGYYITKKETTLYNHVWKSRRAIATIPIGTMVECSGEYDVRTGKIYLYISYKGKKGFIRKAHLIGGKKR